MGSRRRAWGPGGRERRGSRPRRILWLPHPERRSGAGGDLAGKAVSPVVSVLTLRSQWNLQWKRPASVGKSALGPRTRRGTLGAAGGSCCTRFRKDRGRTLQNNSLAGWAEGEGSDTQTRRRWGPTAGAAGRPGQVLPLTGLSVSGPPTSWRALRKRRRMTPSACSQGPRRTTGEVDAATRKRHSSGVGLCPSLNRELPEGQRSPATSSHRPRRPRDRARSTLRTRLNERVSEQ